jgi:ribosomal protein S18 acetylase RimI-like enzyme
MTGATIPWPIESVEERAAQESDYERLWDIHVDAMQRYVAETYGWIPAVQTRLFRDRWAGMQAHRVLVEKGTVIATWWVEQKADELFIAFIEIASSHRRRGIGSVLIRRVLARALALGGFAVRLTVMKANPDARRLYDCLGFSVEGDTATHYRMIARP